MAKNDFYDILGVEQNADAEDIKKSYRKLAMKYHPDRNPNDAGAEKKFKELNEANDVYPAAGKILLQCEGSEVFYRKVELRPLKDGDER